MDSAQALLAAIGAVLASTRDQVKRRRRALLLAGAGALLLLWRYRQSVLTRLAPALPEGSSMEETSVKDAASERTMRWRKPTSEECRPTPARRRNTKYAAVLAHHLTETAAEARAVAAGLSTRGEVLLDSEESAQPHMREGMVRDAEVVLVLLSRSIFESPQVLLTLMTAVEAGVPIVAAELTAGAAPFKTVDGAVQLTRLETFLSSADAALLRSQGVLLTDAAYKLSVTFDAIARVRLGNGAFDEHAQRQKIVVANGATLELPQLTAAAVEELVGLVARAETQPLAESREEWFDRRDGARRPSAASHGADSSCEGAAPPGLAPELPSAYDDSGDSRGQLLTEARHLLAARGEAAVKVALRGSGGAGKTTLAAALAQDPRLLRAFEVAAWVTVGETPDLPRLQRSLLSQWGCAEAAGVADDELPAKLVEATRRRRLLLFLDDVWFEQHGAALCVLDQNSASAALITTRIAGVVRGVVELGVVSMAPEEAVRLLLKRGGVSAQLADPAARAAAHEAAELCGRVPLLLAITGAMIEAKLESEPGAEWVAWLVPALKQGHGLALRQHMDTSEMPTGFEGERNLEERVIASSLRSLAERHNEPRLVELIFTHLAVFPEDVSIPMAVLDSLAPSIVATALVQVGASPRRSLSQRQAKASMRKVLLELTKHSLVLGSFSKGLHMHDIVRGWTLVQAGGEEGGLRAMQRRVVDSLTEELKVEASEKAELLKYALVHLSHHVSCLWAEGTPLLHEPVLARVLLTHPETELRKAAALGLKNEELLAREAQACEDKGLLVEASQLLFAQHYLATGAAAGAPLKKAWALLATVEPSAASADIQALVFIKLLFRNGGFALAGPEHLQGQERLEALAKLPACAASAPLASSIEQSGVVLHTILFMRGTVGLAVDGPSSCSPAQLVALRRNMLRCYPSKAARQWLTPVLENDADAVLAFGYVGFFAYLGVHQCDEYDWEAEYGERGALASALIAHYDFDQVHEISKAKLGRDAGCHGSCGAALLLRWGDVRAATADWQAACASWKQISTMCRHGRHDWLDHNLNHWYQRASRAVALAAGQRGVARALFESSLEGAAFRDESMLPTLDKLTAKLHDFHRTAGLTPENLKAATVRLFGRLLGSLLLDDESSSFKRLAGGGEAPPSWLPSPAEACQIAEVERGWEVYGVGGTHPALLAAALYLRLGHAGEARVVADGVLEHCTQPFVRVEALRLRAKAAPADAAAMLERAMDEAASAQYFWLVAMAARELLELPPVGSGGDAATKRGKGVARKRLREALCSFGADTRQFQAMNDFCAEDGAPPVDWIALAGK